jgi:hypothetical protein
LRLLLAMSPFQRLARPRNGVTLAMYEPLDLESEFHLAAAVQALTSPALVGFERWELRLPKTKNVRLYAAQARNIADLEVQPIGNDGRIGHPLSGKV